MKSILPTFTFYILSFFTYAQDANVVKSTFGIQTGVLGIWTHNESRLSNEVALRSEVGFDMNFWGGDFYPRTGFAMAPVFTLEPRIYYNLAKRRNKSKPIDGNNGNFVSFKTSFHPDWFAISNYEGVQVVANISIIPTWGIRRNIGKHFTYEAGIGLGYIYYFAKNAGYLENEADAALNLHLRFGYRF